MQIGEVREFGIATGGFDGGDELFGGADGNNVVLAAMEGPDGHGFEGVADFIGGRAEAADWSDRGKPVGMFGADGPGSRAALGEAGEVDARVVDVPFLAGGIECGEDEGIVIEPEGIEVGFLDADDDEGPGLVIEEDGGDKADGELFLAIGAALAPTIEHDDAGGGLSEVEITGDIDGVAAGDGSTFVRHGHFTKEDASLLRCWICEGQDGFRGSGKLGSLRD